MRTSNRSKKGGIKACILWQPQPRETKRGRTKNKYYRFTNTHTLFEDTGLATIGARELRLAVLDKDDHHWQRRIDSYRRPTTLDQLSYLLKLKDFNALSDRLTALKLFQ